MGRTAPDHRLCRSQGGPAYLAGVPIPSSSLGPQSQPGMGQRALGQRGQRAGWPLGATYPPGANPRDTQLSVSVGTVRAQCRVRGPPDLWCRPTACPWSSPTVVSLSLPIFQMGPWSSGERRLGMGVEWGDPSGGGASPVPTLLLPRPSPAAARTAGRQAAVLPGEGAVLHHVAPGPLVLVWVPGGQGQAGGRGHGPSEARGGDGDTCWGVFLTPPAASAPAEGSELQPQALLPEQPPEQRGQGRGDSADRQ